MEDEEEGTSYLADLNKAPDFIDEAPAELTEVRISNSLPVLIVFTLCVTHSLLWLPQKPSRPLSDLTLYLISTIEHVFNRCTIDHFLAYMSVCKLIYV